MGVCALAYAVSELVIALGLMGAAAMARASLSLAADAVRMSGTVAAESDAALLQSGVGIVARPLLTLGAAFGVLGVVGVVAAAGLLLRRNAFRLAAVAVVCTSAAVSVALFVHMRSSSATVNAWLASVRELESRFASGSRVSAAVTGGHDLVGALCPLILHVVVAAVVVALLRSRSAREWCAR